MDPGGVPKREPTVGDLMIAPMSSGIAALTGAGRCARRRSSRLGLAHDLVITGDHLDGVAVGNVRARLGEMVAAGADRVRVDVTAVRCCDRAALLGLTAARDRSPRRHRGSVEVLGVRWAQFLDVLAVEPLPRLDETCELIRRLRRPLPEPSDRVRGLRRAPRSARSSSTTLAATHGDQPAWLPHREPATRLPVPTRRAVCDVSRGDVAHAPGTLTETRPVRRQRLPPTGAPERWQSARAHSEPHDDH